MIPMKRGSLLFSLTKKIISRDNCLVQYIFLFISYRIDQLRDVDLYNCSLSFHKGGEMVWDFSVVTVVMAVVMAATVMAMGAVAVAAVVMSAAAVAEALR